MEPAFLPLRILSFAAGVVICYAALFLHEDEEAKVQNTLEQWWIRIDDLRRQALSRQSAFVRAAGEFGRSVLDRVLGDSAISARAASVSACLSIASLSFVAAGLMAGRIADPDTDSFSVSSLLGAVLSPVVIGSAWQATSLGIGALLAVAIQTVVPARWWLTTGYAAAALALTVALREAHADERRSVAAILAVTTLVSVVWNILAIAILRRLLKWQSTRSGVGSLYGAAMRQLCVTIVLTLLPIAFSLGVASLTNDSRSAAVVVYALLLSAASNGFVLLVGGIVVVAIVLLLWVIRQSSG